MAHNDLLNLLPKFAGLKVLVIGEALLDAYHQGSAGRLSREAPVPIVQVNHRLDTPGGAANTATNVHDLGAQVTFLSVIGDDAEGKSLCRSLRERGVSTQHLLVAPQRRTLTKSRVVANSQVLVRFDQGTTEPLDVVLEAEMWHYLDNLFPQMDAVIVSDYGYGVLTPRLIAALASWQRQCPRVLVVDAKDLSAYRQVGITAAKPNYAETLHLLNLPFTPEVGERMAQMTPYEQQVLSLTGSQIVAVTLDTEGALIFEKGNPAYRTYAQPQPSSQAIGAGDTFTSTLALALAAGAYTPAAAELASAAAAIVVRSEGTNTCTLQALHHFLAADEKYISNWNTLAAHLALYREQGRRLVFTNGCFDLLHRGHITYLNQAKALGDVLIVGLNSDESVRRLKGPHRPINTLEDRAQVLAALSCIDHIVSFTENTPHDLIELIQPDVFVKGGDYTRQTLPEAQLVESMGGEVHILPYLQDVSTTSIIERIRHAYAWPADQAVAAAVAVGVTP